MAQEADMTGRDQEVSRPICWKSYMSSLHPGERDFLESLDTNFTAFGALRRRPVAFSVFWPGAPTGSSEGSEAASRKAREKRRRESQREREKEPARRKERWPTRKEQRERETKKKKTQRGTFSSCLFRARIDGFGNRGPSTRSSRLRKRHLNWQPTRVIFAENLRGAN